MVIIDIVLSRGYEKRVIRLDDEPGDPRHPEESLSAAAVKP
jgi:hypothetical protein